MTTAACEKSTYPVIFQRDPRKWWGEDPTDLAEQGEPVGLTLLHARAAIFPDRLLQQRAPLREAPLAREALAQARQDQAPPAPPGAGGPTAGQARLHHPDGRGQGLLVEVDPAAAD